MCVCGRGSEGLCVCESCPTKEKKIPNYIKQCDRLLSYMEGEKNKSRLLLNILITGLKMIIVSNSKHSQTADRTVSGKRRKIKM